MDHKKSDQRNVISKKDILMDVNQNKNNRMNYKNKLNQIRIVLGLQVKLATAKLKDGTVVEAEEFVINPAA